MWFKQYDGSTLGNSQQSGSTAETVSLGRLAAFLPRHPPRSHAFLGSYEQPGAPHCNAAPRQQDSHISGAPSDQRI